MSETPIFNKNADGSYMTEAQIVEDILASRLDAETKALLLNGEDDPRAKAVGISSVAWVLGSFTRWIRNAYGLWAKDNPISKNWDAERLEHIRNDIDYSPSHPDNISMRILEAVVERLRAEAA